MKRVVILGRGGAGKSTLAARLGKITGLPVIELDKHFWSPGLVAKSPQEWKDTQEGLIEAERWIMDGDLGPYDVVNVRIREADTIILMDFSLPICAWRAFRRSRERSNFWIWLLLYRLRSRPVLMTAIRANAAAADLRILRNPTAVHRFLANIARESVTTK